MGGEGCRGGAGGWPYGGQAGGPRRARRVDWEIDWTALQNEG